MAILGVFISAGMVFRPHLSVSAAKANAKRSIQGAVRGDEGTISGAVVRIQATEHSAVSDSQGELKLAAPESFSGPVKL
jgi:uncharacterized protein YqgC (DUF456 family)